MSAVLQTRTGKEGGEDSGNMGRVHEIRLKRRGWRIGGNAGQDYPLAGNTLFSRLKGWELPCKSASEGSHCKAWWTSGVGKLGLKRLKDEMEGGFAAF